MSAGGEDSPAGPPGEGAGVWSRSDLIRLAGGVAGSL